jgi:glycerophosphoryl diester phosphodiesterase
MTLIASHRGGTHLWPENTLLAFRETVALGVEMVEFDVHQTRDGVLVVHHDATIDRMTDGTGPVAGFDFEVLRRHVVIGAGGEPIPTLAEVLDVFEPAGTQLRLEIKTDASGRAYDGLAARLAETLAARGLVARSLITSFTLPCLVEFREALAERGTPAEALAGLMWLCAPQVQRQIGLEGVIAALDAHGVREIGLRAEALTPDWLEGLRGRGIVVHAWAAHSAEAAAQMFALGVASFTTDRPDLALAARPAG